MKNEEMLGKRIVIQLASGVVFAGILKDIMEIDGEYGYFVNTDQKNGIYIWSPCDNTRQLKLIPILEESL